MDLSIIIVNWKSLHFTKKCIASLISTIQELEYEIIVVDNASESCQEILDLYPQVKLIASDQNLGFAQANNLGVRYATGRKLLFLNPDTIVLGDAVLRMALCLDSEKIGAVGCRLLNRDFTVQMSCVQRFPTITNQLLSIDALKRRWPNLPLWGMQPLFSDAPAHPFVVDVVSGACLMVKRHIFERISGFSRDYFMYAEEVDLCWKLRCMGYRVCHISEAQVVHVGGQSTANSAVALSDIALRRSVFKFLRKSRGIMYALTYRVALIMSAASRVAILGFLLTPLNWNRNGSPAENIRALKKWCGIGQWALALRK